MLVAAWSQGAAILVFLVAQLNGITALTSLVALYALTEGTVAITGWVIGWRRQGPPRPVDVVTMTAGVSLAVWAIAVPMLVGTLG